MTIVAIDGPAGAGKSTIATRVAQELGFQLIDTGAIYRTVALRALELDISLDDGPSLAQLAAGLDFEFTLRDGVNVVSCNGDELGDEIRTQEVGNAASQVAAHPEVRQALLNIQRDLGRASSCVLEGRDIGTVVFPDADVKVFLTASAVERARRRVEQLQERGMDADYDAILAEIEDRDARDSQRSAAPLVQAADACAIDSTKQSIDEVVTSIVHLVQR